LRLLGITLNYNGSFIKAKNKLVQQAQKALYSVYRKVQNVCTPVDLQLKLLDNIELPILTTLLYNLFELFNFNKNPIILTLMWIFKGYRPNSS
jgi:hypothetical protein